MMSDADQFTARLRACADESRIRILALLESSELAVTEITAILGQSQPRVSRHLKILHEAGLIERHQEGAWVFVRLAPASSRPGRLVRAVLTEWRASGLNQTAPFAGDAQRLARFAAERLQRSQAYFKRQAACWNDVRGFGQDAAAVEARLLEAAGSGPFQRHVDFGAGAGHMISLFAGRTAEAVGVDINKDMLAAARAQLAGAGVRHAQLRLGDVTALWMEDASADLVTIHQMLHYLDEPGDAVREAVRILKPGGRLLIADFAPHSLEHLRKDHAHRRLGFSTEEIAGWLDDAGGALLGCHRVGPSSTGADQLTVLVAAGERPVLPRGSALPAHPARHAGSPDLSPKEIVR